MRPFHDLTLWAKVLLGLTACLVAGIAVTVSIWLGAAETEGRLAQVTGTALPTAAAGAQLLDVVDTIQTKAMRAMVWQQAGVAEATIGPLVADIGHAMAALRSTATGMVTARAEGDADVPRLRSIAAMAADYTNAATAEIARNVAESAAAASEITQRTNDASSEAEVTGRTSVTLRDNTAALNLAVDQLRKSVLEVVRTSTAAVERRQLRRNAVDLGAELSIAGNPVRKVTVGDLSEGGAQVHGVPDVALGTPGTLRLDGLANLLPGSVRAHEAGRLHLAFDLDPAAARSLRTMLARLETSRAA